MLAKHVNLILGTLSVPPIELETSHNQIEALGIFLCENKKISEGIKPFEVLPEKINSEYFKSLLLPFSILSSVKNQDLTQKNKNILIGLDALKTLFGFTHHDYPVVLANLILSSKKLILKSMKF